MPQFRAAEQKPGLGPIEEKKNGNIVIAGEFGEEAKFGRDLKLTADDGATFIAQLDNNGNFTNA